MKTLTWFALTASIVLLNVCGVSPVAATTRANGVDEIQTRLRAGRFADAERAARQRLSAVESESGKESVEAANVLDLLSEALRLEGKGGEPELGPICERAVRIKEKAFGQEDPRYAASLYQLGCWRYANAEYGQASELLDRSLRIREAALGPDDLDVASSLVMLGAVRSEQGDHATARPLLVRACSIRQAKDPNSPGVAECLNVLASVDVRLGDYASAEPMYRRSIRIWADAWGTNHPKVGTGWNNLSSVLYATGDYEGALDCKERALKIRTRIYGPKHELVGWTRANMGMNLAALDRKDEARGQYREAIDILGQRFGPTSTEVGWVLKRLGDTYLEPGHYKDAVPILEMALSNLRAGDDPDHPDVGEAMAALGAARTALGDSTEGDRLNRQALAILRKRLGEGHPEVAFTLTQHASALVVSGAPGPALEEALDGEEISREHLRLMCRSMPERAALAYAGSRPAGGRLALSVLGSVSNPDMRILERSWDSLIRSRTLVLDEMTLRMRAASEASDPRTKDLVEDLNAARRRLANLIVSGPGEAKSSQFRSALAKAREANEDAERALAARSSSFERDRGLGRVGLRDVLAALPQGSALAAFATAGEGRRRTYVCFVARAGGSRIWFHSLGPASKVESAISKWMSDVGSAGLERGAPYREPSRTTGATVAKLIWSPIAGRMQDIKRLFVVGDGALLFVNLGALPSGRSRYLIEDGPTMHYLTSERDLVRSAKDDRSGVGLLALADPAFDSRPTKGGVARARGLEGDARDAWNCGDFRDVQFRKLPQTGNEARDIARIWDDPSHTTLLTGPAASEATFKKKAAGHEVLHLATHGFFLDGSCELASKTSRSISITVPMSGTKPAHRPEANPVHLSGLALAGANERSSAGPDDEDGILTAEEIAGLHLDGTEWAVLSACDTGKGKVQVGEGVLGLRRAFQSAGARTVIMSLWAVEDESARQWMEALYEGRVRRRLDTADAVTQADLKVLRARRAQARSTNPFYWAAFVATGDWR